jgi:putative methionine-R-sulfoxide reductase with GAF domain
MIPLCPPGQTASMSPSDRPADSQQEASQRNTLQALLTFLALHQQLRWRKALGTHGTGDDGAIPEAELGEDEPFTLDEMLQLVADRAVAITRADGLAIALVQDNEIVLRAAAGRVRPDRGARIDSSSAFSGACFRTAQIVTCDDTETDARVNRQACRRLGTRSMVALPLCARGRAIGSLQAFSAQPFGFNDSDVRNLSRLAALVMGAFTPEEEQHLTEIAALAATKLEGAPSEPEAVPVAEPEMSDGKADSVTHKPAMLVLLVCLVIVAALAARVWWKPKLSHRSNHIVRTEEMAAKPKGATEYAPAAPSAGMAANPGKLNPAAAPKESRASHSHSRLRELSKFPMVTGIHYQSSAGSSSVVLDLEDQVQYEAHRLANPDRIYLDLHDTQLASQLSGKSFKVGDAVLKRIRVAQPVIGVTRIVLETIARSDFSVSLEPNPYRLVVEVRKVVPSSKGVIDGFPTASRAKRNTLPTL